MWLFSAAVVFACLSGTGFFPSLTMALLLLGCAAGAMVRRSVLRLPLWMLAGLCWGSLSVDAGLEGWLPERLEGEPLVITGRVVQLPRKRETARGTRRWDLVLDRVRSMEPDWRGPHRVRVSLYDASGPFVAGDELRLRVRLRRPRGRVNEGGLDSARLDLARGIAARGSVREVLDHQPRPGTARAWRQRFSSGVRERFTADSVAASLVPALVAGDRRHLSDEHWTLLQRTGTAHLMAISGLHISLVTGLVWLLARWLVAPLLSCRGAGAQQAAVLPALLAALGYAALAGFALPTVRALAMNLVALAMLALRVRPPLASGLGLALFVLLLVDPLAALDNSFWMSFLAVAMLLLVAVAGGDASRAGTTLRVQLVLALGLGGLTGWLFLHWGLLSPVANIVMVPVFSLVVVPLALAGALLPSMHALLDLAAMVLELTWRMLQWLDGFNVTLPPPPDFPSLVLLIAAVLVMALPRLGVPGWLALFLLLPWVMPRDDPPGPAEFDLVVLDVGQGQAVAVRTRNHLVLYDLGPGWDGGDAGRLVLRPWLRRQRRPVTLALVSHGDRDHAGGLASLGDLLPENGLYSGEPERVPGARPCRAGQQWRLDGVIFRVLWPPPEKSVQAANNRSCVVRVSGKYGSTLLTGDIGRPVEYWIAEHHAQPVTILQAPHHGSARGSSYTLLRALRPEQAFASAGYRNRFGHPAERIRKRYERLGIDLHVTATSGMIEFRMRGSHNAAPLEWRKLYPGPWRP